ncbi:hypothetical protein POREN0001_1472 [Porphyromonas endodontalis ATCC 35406]|uniref:Uncharacterized protein n=1 Tax=Porphyromonas endodontalis (strain ATCC 35406 / DSM 24491 / JCM 8526 / CCUG 16442 / BCRC 14492 / NCTC 13058 / HG 370) TaxID=553175 RepID=C3JB30_POREA|nr:hypothetical protein POREN0001_1472 [Porphyromonas endodontalis ATCC 35406]
MLLLSITYSIFAGLHLPIVCRSHPLTPMKKAKGYLSKMGELGA